MRGILVLAHGSRAKETELTLEKIVGLVRENLKNYKYIVEYAFMEFSDKNIKSGLESLINKGVKDIKVIPYFLFEGIHIKEDIPNEINEVLKDHKDINVTMGKTFGTDQRLADILTENAKYE